MPTNILDNNTATEYCSQGLGASTYIDFDLGAPKRISGLEFLDRSAAADEIFFSKLTFSNDPTFTTNLGEVTVHHEGQATEHLYTFPDQNARYVRWQVTETVNNATTNAGGKEMGFYASIPQAHFAVPAATVTNSATAHSAGFVVANLFDGNLATEYCSQGLGAVSAPLLNDGTFVEMDFGRLMLFAGFEHLGRLPQIDQIDTSQLFLSTDPTFDMGDPTVLIDHNGAAAYQTFAPVWARYVRWEVLSVVNTPNPNTNNVGGKEMVFYAQIPEPGTLSLLALGGLGMLARRRRKR
jgi:hypothetical protein